MSRCVIVGRKELTLITFSIDRADSDSPAQDNIGAWFYFFAFNVLVSWYLAVLLDLLPLAVIALVRAVWGSVTEKMKIHVETYGVVKGWIKPIFYAASIWGSWAVIFQQIYNLHSTTDDVPSRAPYTRRVRSI